MEAGREARNRKRWAEGLPQESAEELAARIRDTIDSLFIFTSFEELRRGFDVGDDEGGTLHDFYRALPVADEGERTSLRQTAELRKSLG